MTTSVETGTSFFEQARRKLFETLVQPLRKLQSDPLHASLGLPEESELTPKDVEEILRTVDLADEEDELPENEASRLAETIEDWLAGLVSEQIALSLLIVAKGDMLVKSGQPHDRVPADLMARAQKAFGEIEKLLVQLRGEAANLARQLDGSMGVSKRTELEHAVGQLEKDAKRIADGIPLVAPPIEQALVEAVKGATEAYAKYLFLPKPVILKPEGGVQFVPEPEPEPEPVTYPEGLGGKLMKAVDGFSQRLTEIRKDVGSAIEEKADMLTKAGPEHAKLPAVLVKRLDSMVESARNALGVLRSTAASYAEEEPEVPSHKHSQWLEDREPTRDEIDRQGEQIEKIERSLKSLLEQAVSRAAEDYRLFEQRNRLAETEFAKALSQLRPILEAVETWDAPEAPELLARRRKIEAEAPNNWVAALEAIRAVQRDAIVARDAIEDRFGRYRIAVEQRIEQAVAKRKEKEGRTVRSEFIQAIEAPIAEARSILASGKNLAAATAAMDLANEAYDAAAELVAAIDKLDEIEPLQRDIAKVLDKGAYKTLRPKDQAALKARYAELEKGWVKMNPDKAVEAHAVLKEAVLGTGDSFQTRCEAQAGWASEMKQLIKDAEKAIKALDTLAAAHPEAGTHGRKYLGQLGTELAAIKALHGGEPSASERDAAKLRIQSIKRTAELYAQLTPEDLAPENRESNPLAEEFFRDQKAGGETAAAELKAKEDFERDLKALKIKHSDCASEESVKADKGEHDAIGRQIKAAENAAKSGDNAGARAMLKRAQQRLDALKNGPPPLDRENLGKIGATWNRASLTFRGKCDDLVTAVRDTAKETPRAGAERDVELALKGTVAAINALDFAPEGRVLGSETSKEADRKRARETALAKIRQASTLISGNPAVRLAVANPFGVDAVASEANSVMKQIELEVLRGV